MDVRAVVMAGGEGTRLRPLTSNSPKPMLPMANRPIMEHVVRRLASSGFDQVIVTVAFLASQVRNYFGDGSEFGVQLRYATEETPLGTAGSIRNAAAALTDTFLVVSGDVVTDADLTELVKAHRASGAVATIALRRVTNPVDFGIVITGADGSIERFLEKPTWGQVFSDTINTGMYVLEPEILELIAEGRAVDFSEEVFPAALERGMPLYGHVIGGYWEDVGTLEAYVKAHRDVLDGYAGVEIPGFEAGRGVWLGEGVDIDPGAIIKGPVVIGDNCRIEAGAQLREYTVLGADVVVKHDAFLERAVIHDHVYVGPGVRLRGCVIGASSDLRQGARAEEGVVLGERCFVGEHAVVNQGVKIYPFKTVEPGAVVNSSIVWESRGARTLFGRRGVRGLANVDVTAELAVRLAAAYGSSLKKGAVVTVSRDTSRVARALKRAVIAGLNLSGVHVDDLELAPVPLARFQVRSERAQGGITVRLAPGDPGSVELRFFDADGRDLEDAAQRKIDRLLARGDYRRAFAGDIGDIVFPPRAIEYYTAALEASIDPARIRARRFKVVLDYSFGATSIVAPNVLAKVGAEVLSVNPYAATVAGSGPDDLAVRVQRVADLVRASGSDFGAVLDPDGETLVLVDDEGRILSHREALLVFVMLVSSCRPGARLAMPVSVTREAERLAAERGAEIVWTKLAAASLMEVSAHDRINFAASEDGGYIWPDFLPAYDALATVARTLDLLAESGRSVSSLARELPWVHVAHEAVATPWEDKGTVMRTTVEQAGSLEVVLVDGVKVLHPDGWALVLPDPEEALTHVWAEAGSDAAARQRAQEYARRIRQFLPR
ncbi:MAG: sugar phosphate nucleotidyltransferase [Acidimicrobiia bacterium]